MVKIVKPGQKEFHGFCKWCGCEFTYEISDLKLSATSDKLDCPPCGKDYYHPTITQEQGFNIPKDFGSYSNHNRPLCWLCLESRAFGKRFLHR